MRPSRYLIALGAIFVVLFSVVLGGGSGSFSDRLKPRLGLDLAGGSQLTLVAQTTDNKPPSAENLELARGIIEKRVNGLGVSEAEVVTEGNDQIVISAPGDSSDTIQQVGVPAQLRFRKVLNVMADSPDAAPSPSASASASASASGSASSSASAGNTPAAAATPPPTTPAATPSASGSGTPSPGATPSPDRSAQQAEILQTIGSAAASTAAQIVSSPPADLTQIANDPTTMAALEPFRKLKPDQIAILPIEYQFYVPQITCEKLNKRPPGSIVDKSQKAIGCEDNEHTKYLMDVASVEGIDVSGANATINTSGGGAWQVDLSFNSDGAKKWTALTQQAINNTGGGCATAALGQKSDGSGTACLVAIVLDNTVVSAPVINQVLSTQSTISGGFNQDSATLLASQLRYGALPLTFKPGNLLSISASLGTDYLRAGLLAAGIGLLLVVVYAFFYYRLLGLVITLSLLLSGLLTFGMLVLLGREIGFTLSLAGIAGFIVSLGVAADSFVIYFERLKDEIREGRSPRSAVPRAWHRARRTIITANVVTVLAAVVLYLIGVSSVKGFAFALGLATVLDLIIVFLFRHPMMTMLARSPAFLSPRVSGLGRVLQHASSDDTPPSRTRRPKEA